MNNQHLKQLSNDIKNCRNEINEARIALTNLEQQEPPMNTNVFIRLNYMNQRRSLILRIRGLKIYLKNLENKLTLLLN